MEIVNTGSKVLLRQPENPSHCYHERNPYEKILNRHAVAAAAHRLRRFPARYHPH